MSLSPRLTLFASLVVSVTLAGCDCSGDHVDTIPNNTYDGGHGVVDGGSDAGFDAGFDAGTVVDLLGVWTVDGTDTRGSYHGQVELRLESTIDGGLVENTPGVDAGTSGIRFTRVVRYNNLTVEDGRDLWWVWEGSGHNLASYSAELSVSLGVRDFIKSRDSLIRAASDAPVQVTGRVVSGASVNTSYIGTGISATELWTGHQQSGVNPIFQTDRRTAPTNDEPSATNKTLYSAAYFNFWSLPDVSPFVSRPEFQKMVHGVVTDKTDFTFYQANQNSLRVVDKIIDPISLLETMQRANAYRQTLISKGTASATDTWNRFVSPTGVAMVPDSINADGTVNPSSDSALWTAMYLAAEAYRFDVTADVTARDHFTASLDSLLKLQEITGDWTKFARALRPGTGAITDTAWHQGTASFASLQYLEGGNNDMMKGLQYGYVIGWRELCSSSSLRTTNAAICARLKTNIDHLSDIDLGTLQNTSNGQVNHWLRTVIRQGQISDIVEYGKQLLLAEVYGVVSYASTQFVDNLQNGPVLYVDGVSDWSGLHLNFVDLVVRSELTNITQLILPTDLKGNTIGTNTSTQLDIAASHDVLRKEHLPLYHALAGAYAVQDYTAADQEDLRWTLRSMRYPKTPIVVDHSLNATFSISPFPNLPWKLDWTTVDRRGSLTWLPLFEVPGDVYQWKNGRTFAGNAVTESSTVDYLHLYWFARKFNLLGASE